MTGYRDGYDVRKWAAAEAAKRPRRRSARWTLAVLTAVMLCWLVAATALSTPDATGLPDMVFIWLPLIAMMGSPFARDTWLTDRGLEQFDEFERAALARATSRAYLLMTLGGAAGLLATAAALHLGQPIAITPHLLMTWVMGLLGIGLTLPILLAEWTVPFPDSEDQSL